MNHPFDPEWDTSKGWKTIPWEEVADVFDGPEQECIPITAETIMTFDPSKRPALSAWLEKELADNPDHPTNMYLTRNLGS